MLPYIARKQMKILYEVSSTLRYCCRKLGGGLPREHAHPSGKLSASYTLFYQAAVGAAGSLRCRDAYYILTFGYVQDFARTSGYIISGYTISR